MINLFYDCQSLKLYHRSFFAQSLSHFIHRHSQWFSIQKVIPYTTLGINKMTSTAVILIGAGAIAGIISKSNISDAVVYCTQQIGISGVFIAPIS